MSEDGGPTADGRMKPDIVAPGERIVSCAPMANARGDTTVIPFREDSGTSMAAPAVTGTVALLLAEVAARGQTIQADEIRGLLMSTARANPPVTIARPNVRPRAALRWLAVTDPNTVIGGASVGSDTSGAPSGTIVTPSTGRKPTS